ncbi:MAG: DUF2807 domain-containing protein [Spirochaetaceae bacterium]|nr:DUF2807 domain-containing protein [Spirochaetaceae bacterium]
MAGASGLGEEGSGTLVTERLALWGFTGIEVGGSWRITVRPGPYDVQVTVDDNVVDDLRVEVRGDALHFGLRPQVRLRRVTLRAQVTMPALDAVRVSGSGEATFADFESPSLRLGVSGSGDVEGSGISVGVLDAGVSGSGDITLEGCASESAGVSITGSGDVTLRGASDEEPAGILTLQISGSGSAELDGCAFASANVGITGSGSGTLTLGSGDLTGSISGSGEVRYRGSPARVDVRTTGLARIAHQGG